MSRLETKISVKRIILSLLGCLLILNILATVMNDRYDALQVKFLQSTESVRQCLAQIEKLSAENQSLRTEIKRLGSETASLRRSIDQMKAQSHDLAKEEYARLKQQLHVLSDHFEEMGKKLAQ